MCTACNYNILIHKNLLMFREVNNWNNKQSPSWEAYVAWASQEMSHLL